MRNRVYISLFAVTLWGAAAARADLTATSAALVPVSPVSAAVVSQVVEPIATVEAGPFGLLSIHSPRTNSPLTRVSSTLDHPATAAYEIRSIPAAPGSTVLCLWALGSIGAWQIARSSRNVHFSALPEWYHADAPDQIGHVTLFDLVFGDMPAAAFDRPACRLQFSSIMCRNRERWLPPLRWHVPTRDPRGPPSSG